MSRFVLPSSGEGLPLVFIEAAALAAQLGARARETIPRRFTMEKMIVGYVEIYLSLLSS